MRRNDSEVPPKSTRNTKRINKQTSKRRGELAELAFLFKAASLGFTVAKPYGDSDRYDFILDTGQRLCRVQVKSASRLSQGAYFLTTQRCCNGVSIPYTRDEIDFLAGYIFPENAWVVIPVEALQGRTSIHIFPRDRQQHGIYANYREAWCQLACPRHPQESRQPTAPQDNAGIPPEDKAHIARGDKAGIPNQDKARLAQEDKARIAHKDEVRMAHEETAGEISPDLTIEPRCRAHHHSKCPLRRQPSMRGAHEPKSVTQKACHPERSEA